MPVKDIISTLNEFVDVALRNRKYAPNTAYGYKAALRIFAGELTPEELQSLDLFKERFDQIFSTILSKKQKDFNISSLQVYKRRVLYVLRDYEKYGVDPSKMANWAPQIAMRTKSKISKSNSEANSLGNQNQANSQEGAVNPSYGRYDIPIRGDAKITITYPHDITKKEAAKIETFGVFLKSDARDDESP